MNKTMFRFYTVADFEEEENWLREEHLNGWKLVRMIPPCIYIFESCEREDVIYRLDFKPDHQNDDEYLQLVKDYGWEYFGDCIGWMYFRRPADETVSEEDGEILSDNASRVARIDKIIKTRLLPLCVIFLCCVVPNLLNYLRKGSADVFDAIFCLVFILLFVIYVFLITHCGLKLKQLKNRYLA